MKKEDNLKLFNLPTEREQEFIELYNKRLDRYQIASIMMISIYTVDAYTHRLKRKGLLPPVRHLDIKPYIGNALSQNESIMKKFVQEHEGDFADIGSYVKYVDIENIKKVVRNLGYKNQDVKMLLSVYAERGLYEEALNLLYEYEENTKLSENQHKVVADLKRRFRIELLKDLNIEAPSYLINQDNSDIENER